MTQLAIPVEVSPQEVSRVRSLGESIALCARAAGLEPKEVIAKIGSTDKAQWSRWESGAEGVIWPKFIALMDACGNDAPLLWMNHARGYDITSMRKRESELQAELRRTKEENAALRRVLMGASAA